MRFTHALGIAALVAAAAVLTTSALAGSQSGAAVKVGSSSLGRILVDSHGKTLYLWAHDRGSRSTCYGACATCWPPLLTVGKPRALSGARSALLGTSRRTDGRMQVTYHGHRLYLLLRRRQAARSDGR
jgi:predicted lipoprotein with Yx(FWY)xxD motif